MKSCIWDFKGLDWMVEILDTFMSAKMKRVHAINITTTKNSIVFHFSCSDENVKGWQLKKGMKPKLLNIRRQSPKGKPKESLESFSRHGEKNFYRCRWWWHPRKSYLQIMRSYDLRQRGWLHHHLPSVQLTFLWFSAFLLSLVYFPLHSFHRTSAEAVRRRVLLKRQMKSHIF